MPRGLDPNDWIDPDDVFEDDYDAERITYAEFVIIRGDHENLSLVFWDTGISLEGGSTGCNWALSFYSGYQYNGQDIPIGDYAAEHVLSNLAKRDLESFDWEAQDWTYFE